MLHQTTGTLTTRRDDQECCPSLSDSPSPEARSVYKNPPQLSSIYLQQSSSKPYTSQFTFLSNSFLQRSKGHNLLQFCCQNHGLFTTSEMKSRFTVSKDMLDHGLKLWSLSWSICYRRRFNLVCIVKKKNMIWTLIPQDKSWSAKHKRYE